MIRIWAALLLAIALTASNVPARADNLVNAPVVAQPEDVAEPTQTFSTWVSLRLGAARAPFYSPALTEVRSRTGQARVLRFGGAARVTRVWWLGAHLAYAFPGVEQPAGSYRSVGAWGNPILFAETRAELANFGIDGRLRLSGGLPFAERGRGDDLLEQRALVIADALHGMTESELFTPGVLPVTATGSLVLKRPRLRASLRLELPWLLRLTKEPAPDAAHTSALAFVPNLEPRVTFWPWPWFGASLGGTLAWPLVRPAYLSERRAPLQAMLAPRLLFAIRGRVLIVLNVDVATGGQLSGTGSGALGVSVSLD